MMNVLAEDRGRQYINGYMNCRTVSGQSPQLERAIDDVSNENVFCSPRLRAEPADKDMVEEAFKNIPAVKLGQAWDQMKVFHAGWAKTAHTDAALLVLASFEDEDVFNPVSGFNQPAYQHGDVCEVFWLPQGADHYAEIHVTPEGSIWQAVFPIDWMEKKRKGQLPNAKIEDLNVWSPRSRALNWRTQEGWASLVVIPFTLFGGAASSGRIAICRYDYTRGKASPSLSSTAAFPRCDFHLHQFWSPLNFKPIR